MRCHYEVLELLLSATHDEIKKQYRILALKVSESSPSFPSL